MVDDQREMNSQIISKKNHVYDSHVHWMATGEIDSWISLRDIKSKEELESRLRRASPQRSDWFMGFGWDNLPFEPHRDFLDSLQIAHPMALYRSDGHALWCNSKAFEQLKLMNSIGGRVCHDSQGRVSGVFVDKAKEVIEANIPPLTRQERRRFLLEGMNLFLKAGFTHIRDVGGCWEDWLQAQDLARSGELHLSVEMYFNLEAVEDLDERIREILEARSFRRRALSSSVPPKNSTLPSTLFSSENSSRTSLHSVSLQPVPLHPALIHWASPFQTRNHPPQFYLIQRGLKIFFDGALGSEGAYLSQPYPSGGTGLQVLSLEAIEEILRRCWAQLIPVAIHALGDEAVHQLVVLALRLKSMGIEGELHLEHCQVVRSETIQLMKGLRRLYCHLQPSHFLSDRRWLREKLGSLFHDSFPWHRLEEAGIPFYFGSDSPIEKPCLGRTREAIKEAERDGIRAPRRSVEFYHSPPDLR